jgi:two-component system, chemotaxis family, chemotaxis protein CheY
MPPPTNALIVDDEAHVRTFLRLLLRELGITQTWEADDGAAAVEQALAHKPDLVLLDINLPVMTGLQALAKLRQVAPEIPVVMVTSQSALTTVREAVRLGAAGYVLKHTPKAQTLAALREVIDGLAEPRERAEVEDDEEDPGM